MLRLVAVTRTKKASADQVSAGLRAFFRIADLWKLNNEQAMVLLGQPSKSTFHNWKKGTGVTASVDLATRLGYVLGIFRALEILYQQPEMADRWVGQPNLALGGQSALERMMGGQITDLARVRDYLDSVRGGW
ncbi:MAG: antitoxin Xre/MbcA/ParS toxin-binding domain-containing protein [Hyphomicrobium sp.]|uniref:MbcA/ParS/Xre antitoxin family protein n=1 Tax=Hyphomicrobium sp. TaxID=82 RepID=UPI003D0F719E